MASSSRSPPIARARRVRPLVAAAVLAAAFGPPGPPAALSAEPQGGPPVSVFEDRPPSVEQLRRILVPESRPGGLTRRLEIPRRDSVAAPSQAQPAAAPADLPTADPGGPSARPSAAGPVDSGPADPGSADPGPAAAPPSGAAGSEPAEPRRPASEATAAAAAGSAPGAPRPGIVAYRIQFALDSATIPSECLPYVDRVGELLRQERGVRLVIEGHTDARGSTGYNLDLSRRRALAVAEYLVRRRGVEAGRLVVEGKGKSEPLLEDPYDARNRRVQFLRAE